MKTGCKRLHAVVYLVLILIISASRCNSDTPVNPDRVWWNSLNETWQIVFLREIDKLGKKPTDEDLTTMINLQQINCDHFPLGEKNLEPLQRLTRLKSVSAGSTHISSIAALADLDSLQFVNIIDTPTASIEALRNHKNLEWVCISLTKVSDISPLIGKKKLQVLSANGTSIKSITPIMELPSLTIVEICNTEIPQKQIDVFMEKHKNCDILFECL